LNSNTYHHIHARYLVHRRPNIWGLQATTIICCVKQKCLQKHQFSTEQLICQLFMDITLGPKPLYLEGVSSMVIMGINQPSLTADWGIDSIIKYIHQLLATFPSWKLPKFQDNRQAYVASKWAACHNSYGGIPCNSPLFSYFCLSCNSIPSLSLCTAQGCASRTQLWLRGSNFGLITHLVG
jgi:hypothetical protein